MGYISSNEKCPRCKRENMLLDYSYNRGYKYTNCPDCGFHYSFSYKTDSDGNYVLKDKTKGLEWSNLIPEEILIENPFGRYCVKKNSGLNLFGVLESEDDYQKFISEIFSLSNQEHDMKEVIVTRFLDGEIKKELIFSNLIWQ